MKDEEGDVWKRYEKASELVLEPRLPVIIRLDGNSFSKLTKQCFVKPFDETFDWAMNYAAKAVMNYCAGVCFAYVQSDEITVVLRNDQRENTTPFLANRTQKIASLTASVASTAFNKALAHQGSLRDYKGTIPVFDCRVFTVPSWEEVYGVVSWRQKDCYVNAVSSFAQHMFKKKLGRKKGHNHLHGMGTRQMLAACMRENEGLTVLTLDEKRRNGRTLYKRNYEVPVRIAMYPEVFAKLMKEGKIKDPDALVTRTKIVTSHGVLTKCFVESWFIEGVESNAMEIVDE